MIETSSAPGRGNTAPTYSISNLTGTLGGAFNPGSIQSFGVNNTSILVAGVGYYDKPAEKNLPSLLELNSLNTTANGTPMLSLANRYFHNGTVFGAAWNGSSWLLTGEAVNGNVDGGSVISISGGNVMNLTPEIEPFFNGGGAWFDAWNGSGWLIGGNNDRQAVLVGIYQGQIVNYTPFLGEVPLHSWIQLIEWNGSSWLIGGHLVFGFLTGLKYSNVLKDTQFSDSGVFGALFWNNKWYIGGGAPAALQVILPNGTLMTFNLPTYFTKWINGITFYHGYFLIGGETSVGRNRISSVLYAVNLSVTTPKFYNLTGMLPGSFNYGLIQFLADIQFNGYSGVLIAGQGFYNETSGYSTGALGLLSWVTYPGGIGY